MTAKPVTADPLAIVILAAGQGTRMKSPGHAPLPKVMHKLAGLPMIGWLLKTAQALNPEKIIVVIGPDMKELEHFVRPHETVVQAVRDGTAGALRTALPKLKGFTGDVLVLVGDMPLVRKETLERLVKARGGRNNPAIALLGCALENPYGYGRLIMGADDILERIVEEKDADPKEKQVRLINTGACCIDGTRLESWLSQIGNDNAQGEFYLTDLPEIAARDGALTRVVMAGDGSEIQGCNTRLDLAALESAVQGRLRIEMMAAGVSLLDPSSVYLHHDTQIGAGSLVEPHVFFGAGVKTAENVHIKAFSYLEGVKIGKNAAIGPFARLRPDTQIGEEVRIGNFVEIKKSKIAARCKIGHLAYVGDTLMGEDVNFSAGAITVNYDGFQKHKTLIGKNVMVGSNVNLVAPLKIDDGAFIAAGSTITEDVPADALSIARDAAQIREGWAARYRKMKNAAKKKKTSVK